MTATNTLAFCAAVVNKVLWHRPLFFLGRACLEFLARKNNYFVTAIQIIFLFFSFSIAFFLGPSLYFLFLSFFSPLFLSLSLSVSFFSLFPLSVFSSLCFFLLKSPFLYFLSLLVSFLSLFLSLSVSFSLFFFPF
jgi:hypothetical protein